MCGNPGPAGWALGGPTEVGRFVRRDVAGEVEELGSPAEVGVRSGWICGFGRWM